jgi:signal transduction histidine kinase
VRKPVGRFFREAVAASAARFAEQAQAGLRAKDAARLRLLRVVGHELANALNTVGAATGVLATQIEAWELRSVLDICMRGLTDLRTVLDDLRDYSALLAPESPLEPERVDLARFARETAELQRLAAEPYGVQLRVRVDPALPVVYLDPVPLRKIVNNLVTNALKYRPPGQPDSWVELAFEALDTSHWRLTVADNGLGIAPEDQGRIFEEFERVVSPHRPVSGAGLGLTITRKLAELFGGQIRVHSEVGRGSRFEVDLPYAVVPRQPGG